jgi:hypothetical protein
MKQPSRGATGRRRARWGDEQGGVSTGKGARPRAGAGVEEKVWGATSGVVAGGRRRVGRRPSGGEQNRGWPAGPILCSSRRFVSRSQDRRKSWSKQAMSVSPSSLDGPSATPFRQFTRPGHTDFADVRVHLHREPC